MSSKHDPFVKEGDIIVLRSQTETIKGEVAAVKPGNVVCINNDYYSLKSDNWYMIKVIEREQASCEIVIKYHCKQCGAKIHPQEGWPECTCGLCLTAEEKETYLKANQPYVLCGACGGSGRVKGGAADEEPKELMCLRCKGLGYLLIKDKHELDAVGYLFGPATPDGDNTMRSVLDQPIGPGGPQRPSRGMSLEIVSMIESIRLNITEVVADCIDSDPISLKKSWNADKLLKCLTACMPKKGLTRKPQIKLIVPTRGQMVQYLFDRVHNALDQFESTTCTMEVAEQKKLDKLQGEVEYAMKRWLKFTRTCNGKSPHEKVDGTYAFTSVLPVMDPHLGEQRIQVNFLLDEPEVYEGSEGEDWHIGGGL